MSELAEPEKSRAAGVGVRRSSRCTSACFRSSRRRRVRGPNTRGRHTRRCGPAPTWRGRSRVIRRRPAAAPRRCDGRTTPASTSTTTGTIGDCPRRAVSMNSSIVLGELHSSVLDRRKPLWEGHLIDGLEDGRFAVYIKAHHALADGTSGANVIQGALSADPAGHRVRVSWAPQPRQGRVRSGRGNRNYGPIQRQGRPRRARATPIDFR